LRVLRCEQRINAFLGVGRPRGGFLETIKHIRKHTAQNVSSAFAYSHEIRVFWIAGAPFRTRRRTHTQLKLLVIFPVSNGSTAVGADFGLTRCRREFQHASRQRAPFALGS
jgi:hypothetical protein